MKSVELELAISDQKIVPCFHDECTFRSNDDQRLKKDGQILKPKSKGIGLLISELICTCHDQMQGPDTGEYARIMLKYGKNHDGYWCGEDVAKQLESIDVVFYKLHHDCLPLYIFDNSVNHKKIATHALKAKSLNLKDGGKTMPLLRDQFHTNTDGNVVYAMQYIGADGNLMKKGLRRILEEREL